jgi:hypothetical protein
LNQLIFRPVKHLKMTIWTSVLWQLIIELAKKWPKIFKKSFFARIFANNDFSLRFAKVMPCFSKKVCIFFHWILDFNLAIMNKWTKYLQKCSLQYWNGGKTRIWLGAYNSPIQFPRASLATFIWLHLIFRLKPSF